MNFKAIGRKASIFFLVVLILFELFVSCFYFQISAAVITYSDVMDDLRSDSTFSEADYPALSYDKYASLNGDSDPSNDVTFLKVIHIAEGENGELFIYTYQPMNHISDITASSVLIYMGETEIEPEKYPLKCVSQEGVFKKYVVEKITHPASAYRYYNIVEIERPFDKLLDEKISEETITNYIAHPVGQRWCCYYYNDKLVYEMVTLDVVVLKPTLTDFIYCKNGITWGSLVGIDSGCNAHYIAFNIENYDVTHIMDASMEYYKVKMRTTHIQDTGVIPSLGSLFGKETLHTTTSYPNGATYEKVELELSDKDEVKHTGNGLFAKSYSWNRIMTATDFLTKFEDQGVVFGENEKNALLNSQYVFAFAETDVSYKSYSTSNPDSLIDWSSSTTTIIDGTHVREVDILRLHFATPHGTYNLGVVSDTTTGDSKPGGIGNDLDFTKDWDKILAVLGVILVLILLIFFFGPVITVIKIMFTVIKFLLSLLFWVVSLLFKLISIPLKLIGWLLIGRSAKKKKSDYSSLLAKLS